MSSGSETEIYFTDDDDDDDDIYSDDPADPQLIRGRRNIKDIKAFHELAAATRNACIQESDRILRLAAQERFLQKAFPDNRHKKELILDIDPTTQEPTIQVHADLFKLLKPHQKEGIRFMWNACCETIARTKTQPGTGCILAHCMGLGKTLQVIAFLHTLLSNKELGLKKAFVLCPKNTLLNWVHECEKWIRAPMTKFHVYDASNHPDRGVSVILNWHTTGGVLFMSYNAFRLLIEGLPVSGKRPLYDALIKPGADVIVCDEGHILKNDKTKLAKVVSQMYASRRIILTGTPVQNNLEEYYCMVNFVRPHVLGTISEFRNMFVHPIQNGQYEDSEPDDVALMRFRSHVLYRKLSSLVQRYDYSTLAEFLPQKLEFVLSVRLTAEQVNVYDAYLSLFDKLSWTTRAKGLFADHQLLQRVWTHPYSLKIYDQRIDRDANKPKKLKKSADDDSDDDEEVIVKPEKYKKGWWLPFFTPEQVEATESSTKLLVLLEIIAQCESRGEKLLVFSGSLFSLETIEHFLAKQKTHTGPRWVPGVDYLMITGATSGIERDEMCTRFNDPRNSETRLFLISTKAGGLGITLNAANRAVIFDASWNPSHDIQSIFRIYRIGQTKPCFVYRLVASGTMEEKIYERQVTKQSVSRRVVDERQIARHYSITELKELYQLEHDRQYDKDSSIPEKDPLLKSLVKSFGDLIGNYHEHDSLLRHRAEEELNLSDKVDAWASYNDGRADMAGIRQTAELMGKEHFYLENFKIVLRKNFPDSEEATICSMSTELIPRLMEVMERPDFTDLMVQEAFAARYKEDVAVEQPRSPADYSPSPRRWQGQNRPRGTYLSSGAALPQPLKVWGQEADMEYGSPAGKD